MSINARVQCHCGFGKDVVKVALLYNITDVDKTPP
jgi:hypothetical protein